MRRAPEAGKNHQKDLQQGWEGGGQPERREAAERAKKPRPVLGTSVAIALFEPSGAGAAVDHFNGKKKRGILEN